MMLLLFKWNPKFWSTPEWKELAEEDREGSGEGAENVNWWMAVLITEGGKESGKGPERGGFGIGVDRAIGYGFIRDTDDVTDDEDAGRASGSSRNDTGSGFVSS